MNIRKMNIRKRVVFWLSLIFLSFLISCSGEELHTNISESGNKDMPTKETIVCNTTKENDGISFPKGKIFYSPFDENVGNLLHDSVSGASAEIEYVFTNAAFKNSCDPKWVENSAISGSALSFDGYSNGVEYKDIHIFGSQLTIDVYICPRAFEWDDPYAQIKKNAKLQVVASCYSPEEKAGFVLGLHKYGDYCFKLALGDRVYELWNENDRVLTYEWAHLTCVFNGDEGYAVLYKNGKEVNRLENIRGSIPLNNSNLYIGKSHEPEKEGIYEIHKFAGLMDELSIYNIALSAEEVGDLNDVFSDSNGKLPQADFHDVWLDETILDDDPYHPEYHAAPPQHWMNEPHALFYYNGYYHLFYQFNMLGPYWRQICWGHWVSEDMVSWTNVKEALVMSSDNISPDGVWSGCSLYKQDGTPVLMFTAGDYSLRTNDYSIENMAIATPKDLNDPYLTEWIMSDDTVADLRPEMGARNEFRDPSVYYEDGTWYMAVGSSGFVETESGTVQRGRAVFFKTTDPELRAWEYVGSLVDFEEYPAYLGSVWELVNFRKIKSADGTLEKYIFAVTPCGNQARPDCYYWLGEFDKETGKFLPDDETPQLMDYGGIIFTGVTLTELPDGRVIACGIVQGRRSPHEEYAAGWAHCAAMPRQILLDENGELIVLPIDELEKHKGEVLVEAENCTIEEANKLLSEVEETQVYVHFNISDLDDGRFEMKFKTVSDRKYAKFTYDFLTYNAILNTKNTSGTHKVSTNGIIAPLADGSLNVEMYIDGALVEMYINGKRTFTMMIYDISPLMIMDEKNGEATVNDLKVTVFNAENEN